MDTLTLHKMFSDAYHESLDFRDIPDNCIGSHKMGVIFFRLEDDVFDRIIQRPWLLVDLDVIKHCFTEKGDNIHLVKAFGEGYVGFRDIIRQLDEKYSPKTITWFRDDFKKLHSVPIYIVYQ